MIKDLHIVVGNFGTPYIAKLLKNNVMSADRKKVDETEFLLAVEHYTKARIKQGDDALEIKTQSGKLVMTITIHK